MTIEYSYEHIVFNINMSHEQWTTLKDSSVCVLMIKLLIVVQSLLIGLGQLC